MSKKLFKIVFFICLPIVIFFLLIRVLISDRTIFLSFRPKILSSNDYVALDFSFNRPFVSFGTTGVYDESTELKYGGEAYDYWYKFLRTDGIEGGNYWNNWSWEDKVVQMHVTMVSRVDGTASFNFIRPQLVNSQGTIADVSINCDPKSTFILSKKNLSIVDSNVDPFSKLSVGAVLYTYCNNYECSSIGKNFCSIIPNE